MTHQPTDRLKLALGVAILCWAILGVGCGDDDSCTDPCDSASESRCSGSLVQTCTMQDDGCLTWADGQDCALAQQQCNDSAGGAICVDDCVNACSPPGETRCSGTSIELCHSQTDGCLAWSEVADCADISQLCAQPAGEATCVSCGADPPAVPAGPLPDHQSSDVNESLVTSLDWADSAGATSYDVYFGAACPPPGHPDPSFVSVTASELGGLTLLADTTYCWQVVALDEQCVIPGPVWTFTTRCADPLLGPPTVTSSPTMLYPSGTTAGVYTLTFSEPVVGVMTGLVWTSVTGNGSLDAVAQVDPQTFAVSFAGAADGDQYTLTAMTTITDPCGNPLAAAVDLGIQIDAQVAGPWSSCANAGTLQLGVSASPANLPTGDTQNDGSGSCWTENGADVIATYVATSTELLLFSWSNVTITSGTWRNYELWRGSCDPAAGEQLHCNNVETAGDSFVVENVGVGDVFFMKAIAEDAGADILSAVFQVDPTACLGAVPGPPAVTSGDRLFNMGVTTGIYTLLFSEAVFDVATNLTWTPVVGSGTMGPVVQVDPATYTIPFSGTADGDLYTLTVSAGVSDDCGSPLATTTSIDLEFSAVPLPGWTDCGSAGTLSLGVPASPLQLPTGDTVNNGAGSCSPAEGADVVARYVATTSSPLEFSWSNTWMDSGFERNYEIWRDSCDPNVGVNVYCKSTGGNSDSVVVNAVAPGDVFYMKAIAQNPGADFIDTSFEVSATTCNDLYTGPVIITSGDRTFSMATVDGTYLLSFHEEMAFGSVVSGITWTPVIGSATLGSVAAVNSVVSYNRDFAIPFVGAAPGDQYVLSIATVVTDVCGNPLTTQRDISIDISTSQSAFWTSCQDAGTLTLGVPHSPPQLPTGESYSAGHGSCYPATGGDLVARYTATSTSPLTFDWSNIGLTTSVNLAYEIWRHGCDASTGVQEYCDDSSAPFKTATINNVSPGEVFYMKTIAYYHGDDFSSAVFQVDVAAP